MQLLPHKIILSLNLYYKFTTSVTELGSVIEGRLGPARHSRTLGFPPIGLVMGGAGASPSQKAGQLFGPLHGWNGHGHSLVPTTGSAGAAVLWFPAQAERSLEEERCAE
jgi:hypothetical protein